MHPITRNIRWCAAPILGGIGFLLAAALVQYASSFICRSLLNDDPEKGISFFAYNLIGSYAAGIAYMWSGLWMAPSRNDDAPSFLGGVAVVVLGISVVIGLFQADWWAIFFAVVSLWAIFNVGVREQHRRRVRQEAASMLWEEIVAKDMKENGYVDPEEIVSRHNNKIP
jgi:hypothetical protein